MAHGGSSWERGLLPAFHGNGAPIMWIPIQFLLWALLTAIVLSVVAIVGLVGERRGRTGCGDRSR
jgi:hypothetical protein